MKTSLTRLFAVCFCCVLACVGLSAQNESGSPAIDRFVISAKAGGVNLVEGAVGVVRKTGKSGQLLKGDALEIDDRVSTGADGKAEILLNPGSFLRLGGNSAFEFKTTALEDLQLRLDRGSAILEVFAAEGFEVAVSTPRTKYLLVETGVYRIDIQESGEGNLEVWKGLAKVGQPGEFVKAGRVASIGAAGVVSISKFDRDDQDALDRWSKARGKELAKMTARLKNPNVRTALMRSFLGRGWNLFGSFGLWVFNPFVGGYVFLPFGNGWGSPYGYSYNCHLGWYNLPPVVWYPPYTGGGSSGGGSTAPTNTPIVSAGTRQPIPPFIRMEQTMGGGGGIGGTGRGRDPFDTGGSSYEPSQSSAPSYSPPASSPPPASTGARDTSTGTKP